MAVVAANLVLSAIIVVTGLGSRLGGVTSTSALRSLARREVDGDRHGPVLKEGRDEQSGKLDDVDRLNLSDGDVLDSVGLDLDGHLGDGPEEEEDSRGEDENCSLGELQDVSATTDGIVNLHQDLNARDVQQDDDDEADNDEEGPGGQRQFADREPESAEDGTDEFNEENDTSNDEEGPAESGEEEDDLELGRVQKFAPLESEQQRADDGEGKVRRSADGSPSEGELVDVEGVHAGPPEAHKVGEKIQNEKDLGRRDARSDADVTVEFVDVDDVASEAEGSEHDARGDNSRVGPVNLERILVVIANRNLDGHSGFEIGCEVSLDVSRDLDGRSSDPLDVSVVAGVLTESGESSGRRLQNEGGQAVALGISSADGFAGDLLGTRTVSSALEKNGLSSVVLAPKRDLNLEGFERVLSVALQDRGHCPDTSDGRGKIGRDELDSVRRRYFRRGERQQNREGYHQTQPKTEGIVSISCWQL